jgi:L-threonylcarbamoyladenylate synthase
MMHTVASGATPVLAADAPGVIDRAVELLAAGEVVALPTETVYGLAADATSAPAVGRIFATKKRPFSDPLIVHLPSPAWLDEVALLSGPTAAMARQLAARFWPGPLTLVLPRRPGVVAADVTAGSTHVAVRLSAHPVFRSVIEQLNRPLAAPSANRFGRISPTCAAHVLAELGGRIPLIIDGGAAAHGVESTILAPLEDGAAWRILRPGPITEEMLAGLLVVVPGLAGTVPGAGAGAASAAPGQMAGHYAPRTPLVLVDGGPRAQTGAAPNGGRLGCLGFRRDWPPAWAADCVRVEYLTESGDLREAAANLFAALRRLDESGVDRILAERGPETGLGRAILERLTRAAAGSAGL